MDGSLQILNKGGNLTQALGNLKDRDPAVVRSLERLIVDSKKDMRERWFGIMALTKLEGQGALARLEGWTSNPQWFIRLASYKAIGYLGISKEVAPIPLVSKGLQDPSILVRDGALETLGRWCDASSADLMLGMLDDPKHFRKSTPLFIRKRAIQTMGKCSYNSAKIRKRLVQVFDEKNVYGIHQATHEALKRISGRTIGYKANSVQMARVWREALSMARY